MKYISNRPEFNINGLLLDTSKGDSVEMLFYDAYCEVIHWAHLCNRWVRDNYTFGTSPQCKYQREKKRVYDNSIVLMKIISIKLDYEGLYCPDNFLGFN